MIFSYSTIPEAVTWAYNKFMNTGNDVLDVQAEEIPLSVTRSNIYKSTYKQAIMLALEERYQFGNIDRSQGWHDRNRGIDLINVFCGDRLYKLSTAGSQRIIELTDRMPVTCYDFCKEIVKIENNWSEGFGHECTVSYWKKLTRMPYRSYDAIKTAFAIARLQYAKPYYIP